MSRKCLSKIVICNDDSGGLWGIMLDEHSCWICFFAKVSKWCVSYNFVLDGSLLFLIRGQSLNVFQFYLINFFITGKTYKYNFWVFLSLIALKLHQILIELFIKYWHFRNMFMLVVFYCVNKNNSIKFNFISKLPLWTEAIPLWILWNQRWKKWI